MRTLITVGVVCLGCLVSRAEPELRGTAPELAGFIKGIPKTVVITGEAEVRVPAHRAVLSLKVTTENKSLQAALRANLDLRGKLTEYFQRQGITADRIHASKFSSTPKYGLFGDKAKSYRVENVMRIAVQDEKEFQGAAGAVDQWSVVQFGGVEFEYADKAALKSKAISQACDNANDRRKIYEERLGLKLTPASFSQGLVTQRNIEADNYGISLGRRQYSGSASSGGPGQSPGDESAAEESISSFGELVYTARVSVECTAVPATDSGD